MPFVLFSVLISSRAECLGVGSGLRVDHLRRVVDWGWTDGWKVGRREEESE